MGLFDPFLHFTQLVITSLGSLVLPSLGGYHIRAPLVIANYVLIFSAVDTLSTVSV